MLRHGLVAIQVLSCISITHAHRQLGYNPLDNIEKYQLLMGESLHDSPTSDPVLFKNEKDYGSIHFHNVTFLSAHNAHANHFAAGSNFVRKMAANQEFSIYRQLKEAGVRGLMLDIQYKDGGIRLVHGIVEYSWLDEILMNEISPFLDEDRDAIITIDLETLGDRELIMRQLRVILKQTVNFTKRIFNIHDKRWSDHEWPTIQQMRDADQRIVIFSDNHIVQSEEYGIMLRDNIMFSNMWGILNGCTPRNSYIKDLDRPWSRKKITGAGTRRWSRLFTMNHFCCDTGIESLKRVKPQNIGGGDNGWGILYPRAMACTAANGLSVKPNYVAVDWAHVGDAADVVDYLNFGGRLGTGQRCDSGLDCATGACSEDMHQCHCQQCDSAATHECSGCDAEESCISTGEKGVHACIPNKSDIFHIDQYNVARSTSFPQSKILMLLIASVFSQSI